MDEADRASSQNEDTRVGFDGQAPCCAQAAGEWLREREVGRGDFASHGGNACERFFGNEDEVGEASVHPCSEQAHVRAHVGTPTHARFAAPAGDFRREADLRPRRGNVNACGEFVSDAPDASSNFVAENDSGGDAVGLLPRRNAQVRAAQGCCFDGEENVTRAKCWDRAFVEYQCAGGVKRRCEHGFHPPSIGLVFLMGGVPYALSVRANAASTNNSIEHMFYIMAR